MTKTTKIIHQMGKCNSRTLIMWLNSIQTIENMNINEPRIKLKNETHLQVIIIFACNIIHYSLQVFTTIKVIQNHFT